MVLILPIEYTCCFRCSEESIKSKVDDLISDKLPTKEAWHSAKDRMLLPVLRRLSLLDARMPMTWTDTSIPLPQCPPAPKDSDEDKRIRSLIRIRFWELCRMARLSYDEYQINFQKIVLSDSFIHAFSSLADSIMSLLNLQMKPILVNSTVNEKIRHDEVVATWNQIKLIRNIDTVLQIIYRVASSFARSRNKTMWMVSFLVVILWFVICFCINSNFLTGIRADIRTVRGTGVRSCFGPKCDRKAQGQSQEVCNSYSKRNQPPKQHTSNSRCIHKRHRIVTSYPRTGHP